jgi:protease PrsW
MFTPTATTDQMPVAPPYPAVLVVSGQPWHSRIAHGNLIPLFQPETHIGRLGTNDVVLTDPQASRMHAVIRWTPLGYELEDLGSSNGTSVGGQRITAPVILRPGQRIRIGGTDIGFYPIEAHAAGAGGAMETASPAAVPIGLVGEPGEAQPFTYTGKVATPPGRLRRFLSRNWWKVLLVGLLVLAGLEVALFDNVSWAIDGVIPVASALVPVTFLTFMVEEDILADISWMVIAGTFVLGAVLGVSLALFLEVRFVQGTDFVSALEVGLIEESAKGLAVVVWLRNRRLHNEIDGLVLGAAAGAGFATLETIGYAVTALLGGFGDGGGVASLNTILFVRGILAPFGHVTWTAIFVAALWRDRGSATLRITSGVVFAFALAVVLHASWDGFGLPGMAIAGLVGIWILRFFVREAVAREERGTQAPKPEPLLKALLVYLVHPFRSPLPQPPAVPSASFAGTWRIAGRRE